MTKTFADFKRLWKENPEYILRNWGVFRPQDESDLEGVFCDVCRREAKELPLYGGQGDPLVGDFSGAKLVKRFREEFPGQVGSSWECRECICRYGTLWEIEEEDTRGRTLTEDERAQIRDEFQRETETMMERDTASPSDASLLVELTDAQIEQTEGLAAKLMPARKGPGCDPT